MSKPTSKANMSAPQSAAAPVAAAPPAKRDTRSHDTDEAAAPASKRQKKDDIPAVDGAADERLDVEAPRRSASPSSPASPPRGAVKKIAMSKENINAIKSRAKGKGKAKAAAPLSKEQVEEEDDDEAAAAQINADADHPKGRKPLPTVSSPKELPAGSKDLTDTDLALGDAALEDVADKNKENLAMRGAKPAAAAARPKSSRAAATRKNFIDKQADAEKVSQIADDAEEEVDQARDPKFFVKPDSPQAAEPSAENGKEIAERQPEVISMAGVKRRAKPLTRDVPAAAAEGSGDEVDDAREKYNAQMRKEKAVREAERQHELEREELRRKKAGGSASTEVIKASGSGADEDADPSSTPKPSPAFSDMKRVAKEKAAHHRQTKGTIRPRKPWTSEEEDCFLRLIEEHGCNWAELERCDEIKEFGGRTQSQLKDKAMNMKALIMKAEAPLPKNFQYISLRTTQKEDIRSCGIDPDNYPFV